MPVKRAQNSHLNKVSPQKIETEKKPILALVLSDEQNVNPFQFSEATTPTALQTQEEIDVKAADDRDFLRSADQNG